VTFLAHSKLTALQREVLDAFFRRERGFFLTGGAALAGFHLGHRTTDDLDLFTQQELAFERGRFVLAEVAAALGGELQIRQDAPGFQRLVLTRGDEGLVIDIVKDTSPQLHSEKLERDPPSAMGLWFALEDATIENGCLWARPGSHAEPPRKRFHRLPGGGTGLVRCPAGFRTARPNVGHQVS
jgi:hypothetical protein